ncbi:DNA-packaging protein [Palleronia sp. LCG004]|uniref:DNA-packaging protein n=1 Tax=Palleronia sp. LCG004 TaxID=3079304 RepID=UPI0029439CDF|nr:terminase family protein [Palleronia sp. LCG004]WOI55018.1 terminase family protein [Palleronia sp. LCG004]
MTGCGLRSGADLIASGTLECQERFLHDLSDEELLALPFLFDFWALDHQIPPEGNWRTWVILGGRGAGKTRAGAEWIRSVVEGPKPAMPGKARRVALVGETLDQVRDVMIFGDSGIMACAPPDRRPVWQPTKKRLVWPNGAQAQIFSAHEPEALRGPQFDAAWVDELAKWKKGATVWDMLQFCLRLGEAPKQCVTTTPRNVDVLKRVLGASSTVVTRATTFDNRAHLSASFLEEAVQRYGQTRLGQQELEGRLLEDIEGALWTHAILDRNRITALPELHRIVVAVDPPISGGRSADTCGIVVVGVTSDGLAVVLEDCSVQGLSPSGWAKAAISAYERYEADRLVAEVNQGGDLVETVIRQFDRTVSYRGVHATRGKAVRAEPVAALYEQGRVKHLTRMHELEAQMTQMTIHGFDGFGSPDRVDALVWALTDLLLKRKAAPNMRRI